MTPHDALYSAICAQPDEDTPRLAFADLVDEDGDSARAAFIRTQVELARAPEYDPIWAKCRQFDPGIIRGWAMTHTLPRPLPDGFSWQHYQFRRGFAWRALVLSAEAFAARSAALFATAPIRALSFDDRARPDLAALAACPDLSRLQRLGFALSRLDAGDLAPLIASPHVTGLNELVFESDAITPDGLEALARSELFRQLETLKLRNNVIPPALLVDGLAAARRPGNLRRLSLADCEIPSTDAPHLFSLPVVQGLDSLDLSQNRLEVDGTLALAESAACRGLRVLKLAEVLPGVPGVRALTQTSKLATVRWLDLSGNRLGPVAVQTIADSRHVRGLRALNLSGNAIGNKGAVALASSRNLAGLIDLDLSDCAIADDGALALASSPHLEGLIRLDIRDRTTGRALGDAAHRTILDRFGPRVSFNQ